MRIGQLAKELGLSPPTLRFYESLGLIPRARRVSGSRFYDRAAVDGVRVVLALSDAGFSLSEIKGLLSMPEEARTTEHWQRAARAKLGELERAIEGLLRTKAVLEDSLKCECEGKPERCALLRASGARRGRSPGRQKRREAAIARRVAR